DENGNTISALNAEIERLRAELERAGQREQDLADTRRAMLYLLEDINEGAALTEKAKKEWEATFDGISDLLFIHGPDMRITRCNRAYKEAAGLKFKEIIGRPYYEVFPVMDGPFGLCKAEGDSGAQEQETDVPSLGKVFKTKFYSIREMDKGVYSIHVMDDITEHKRNEEKIAQEVELTRHLLMIANATAHTTDIDRLMEQVVGCLKNIMRSDLTLSYLWDKERNAFMPCRAEGLTHAQVPSFRVERLDLNSRFVARALEERKTIIENFGAEYAGAARRDIAPDAPVRRGGKPGIPEAAPLHWVEGINTAVVFPLLGREGYLGLLLGIYAGEKNLPEFGERDREVWDGISFQVSTALDEARLYKESIDRTMELSRKVETIRTMHEIDTAILSAVHPEGILDTAARMVGKAVFCDRATIALVDREKECFIYEAGFGISLKKGSLVDFKDTSATEVVKTGMPQYVANIRESGKLMPLEKKFLDEGFLSHIRVPLIVKGEVVGVLSAGARRAAAFSAEDLSIMEKL
ncbi:MAG: GAF domain-containing protein, partial [Deltaproteobacteria bacterium]|nr:GAF domain-containing protein [Deltaproteobacteria bacterium]